MVYWSLVTSLAYNWQRSATNVCSATSEASTSTGMSSTIKRQLLAVYGVAMVSRFTLTKMVGGIFFSFYFAFVAYSLLHEFGKIPF